MFYFFLFYKIKYVIYIVFYRMFNLMNYLFCNYDYVEFWEGDVYG